MPNILFVFTLTVAACAFFVGGFSPKVPYGGVYRRSRCGGHTEDCCPNKRRLSNCSGHGGGGAGGGGGGAVSDDGNCNGSGALSRKELIEAAKRFGIALPVLAFPTQGAFGVTEIPEKVPYKSHLKSITLNTYNPRVHEATADFFIGAFPGFMKLRENPTKSGGLVTVLAFGSDQLSVPTDFVPGISPYKDYGGHTTITLHHEGSTAKSKEPPSLEQDEAALQSTNVAYVKLVVPGYRISKVLSTGASVLSAYGYLNCLAPNGVPVRATIGDKVGDEISYLALRCKRDVAVEDVAGFYKATYGMEVGEVPVSRPGGQEEFDPRTFPGSVYLKAGSRSESTQASSDAGCGLLILPRDYSADGSDEFEIGRKRNIFDKVKESVTGIGRSDQAKKSGDDVESQAVEEIVFVTSELENDQQANRVDPNGIKLRSISGVSGT